MFPKGKFNTDISRNALYKVLFRSPGDRKQIDIMAEQTFAKDRTHFMKAYTRETEKPFGYIVLDNHPRTTNENQVVANVFGDCYTYPCITRTDSPLPQSKVSPEVNKQPKLSVKRKVELPFPAAKRPNKSTVKRKVNHQRPAVRKPKKQTVKRKPTKKSKKQPKVKARTSTDRVVYKPRERFRGGFQKEEQINYEEEQFSSEEEQINFEEFNSEGEIRHCTQDELNELARQAYRVGNSKGGFGPRFAR